MNKNCSTCAFRDGHRSDLCRRCGLAGTHAGSCTGVKYPCMYQCKECFYDLTYNSGIHGKREKAHT